MLNKQDAKVVGFRQEDESTVEVEDITGLSPDELLHVVERGALARNHVSALMPVTSAGYFVWAYMVEALREALIGTGDWEAKLEDGLEKVVNEARNICIVCKSATEGVGDLDRVMKTRKGAGPVVKALADINEYHQFNLFDDDNVTDINEMVTDNESSYYETWFLIYQVDSEANEVRAELAKPVGYDSKDSLNKWEERLKVGTIEFDSLLPTSDFNVVPEQTDEIDFTIERKKNAK